MNQKMKGKRCKLNKPVYLFLSARIKMQLHKNFEFPTLSEEKKGLSNYSQQGRQIGNPFSRCLRIFRLKVQNFDNGIQQISTISTTAIFPSCHLMFSTFLQSSLNFTLIQILLGQMRLSNFTLSSVLSFADKPKLPYLTRPIKNKKKTRKLSAKIDTNSNLTFESKMNLKSISVCTKSIKITAILVTFLRWLQYS